MSDSVQDIFEEICDLSPDDRQAALDRICRNRPELRQDVESLIGAHDEAGDFLGQPTAEFISDSDFDAAPIHLEEGDMIGGRYKILEQIGEGGFGVVYMAQQVEPVRRRVAIKIIKLGMDTKQVVARFEAERQALAMMSHPNIARVLDGGATDTGRPYFVMELVRGDPITKYCDAKRLTTEQRLELFKQVCAAVQHAHQKGIIHRDIKPNNVLVTIANDKPLAKVIDFGIAKATNSELTEKTLFTAFRQLIGTPEYMSPEQAERSGVDVDTRTDIYSLGVLLYEMLTGTTPFEGERLRSAAWGTFQEMILTEDPPVPSTRLSTRKDSLDTVARDRSIDPRRLHEKLKGELDWIVMKALEKDRTRRYSTTVELEADIVRYLNGEPIKAGPPSAIYKWKKYAKRYRGWLAAAGSVFGALLIAIVLTTSTMLWALEERDHARQAELAARQAENRAQRFAAMTNFLMNPAEMEDDRQLWEDEIRRQKSMAPEDPEVVRQECQYAAWLWARGGVQNVKSYKDKARELLAELYPRARRILGVTDVSVFGACNALLQSRLFEEESAETLVPYYDDLMIGLRKIYGVESELNKEVTLEYATVLLKAGKYEESREEFRNYLELNRDREEYGIVHKFRLHQAKLVIEATDFETLFPQHKDLPEHQKVLKLCEEYAPGTDLEIPGVFQ